MERGFFVQEHRIAFAQHEFPKTGSPMNAFTDADDLFMRMALFEAEQAGETGEVPVGAIVVNAEDHVLGKGRNACERLQDPTAHAEMIAITAAANALGTGDWKTPRCM